MPETRSAGTTQALRRNEEWRIFLAVELPPAVKQVLARPLSQLSALHDLVRVSPPEGIHLTLHFLGQVEATRIDGIAGSLEPVLATTERLALEVRGFGAFPSMARPRILWVGITGADVRGLVALQAATGRVLRDGGFDLEARDYAPHLTLGRVRRPANAAERNALKRWQAEGSSELLGRLPVETVSLMRSELAFRPPRYSVLRAFRLK